VLKEKKLSKFKLSVKVVCPQGKAAMRDESKKKARLPSKKGKAFLFCAWIKYRGNLWLPKNGL
jgi:hypothetical protein